MRNEHHLIWQSPDYLLRCLEWKAFINSELSACQQADGDTDRVCFCRYGVDGAGITWNHGPWIREALHLGHLPGRV